MSEELTEQDKNLNHAIAEAFNKSELKILADDLGVEFENLPNASGPLVEVSTDLVHHMVRHNRLPELVELLKIERPNTEGWETFNVNVPKDELGLSATPPFMGLKPYTENDGAMFFGREDETAQIIEHFTSNRFLAVVGPSGVGKSSLIQAGLVHALKHSQDQGSPFKDTDWLIQTVDLNNDNSLKRLAEVLTDDASSEICNKGFN